MKNFIKQIKTLVVVVLPIFFLFTVNTVKSQTLTIDTVGVYKTAIDSVENMVTVFSKKPLTITTVGTEMGAKPASFTGGTTRSKRLKKSWHYFTPDGNKRIFINFDLDDLKISGTVGPASNYVLLDSSSNNTLTVVYTAKNIIGTKIYFDSINITSKYDKYLTLGIKDSLISPLPITLVDFTARRSNNTIQFDWQTASEMNSDFFEIEQSYTVQEGSWKSIYKTIAAYNSTTLLSYTYIMANNDAGIVYYRLKETDVDGTVQYSKIITISEKIKNAVNIYPNPAVESVNIQGRFISWEIVDEHGNTIVIGKDALIDISTLPKGVYYLKINDQNKKLIKQ